MTKTYIFFIVLGAAFLFVGGSWFARGSDDTVISRSGIHWHPRIEIIVGDEKQDIPENIGVGPQYGGMPTYEPSMRMTAMHTHERDGVIHMEFPGRVTEDETRLQNFFRIWGKDPLALGTLASVTINGREDADFMNHALHDRDMIVMRYQ